MAATPSTPAGSTFNNGSHDRRQPRPGDGKGPAPLSRLQQALRRALDATAPLWPEVVIGQGGWRKPRSSGQADGAERATVEARYTVLLADLQEAAPERCRPWPRTLSRSPPVTVHSCSIVTTSRICHGPIMTWNSYSGACAINYAGRPAKTSLGSAAPPACPPRWRATAADLATADPWRAARPGPRRYPRILGRRFGRIRGHLQALEES